MNYVFPGNLPMFVNVKAVEKFENNLIHLMTIFLVSVVLSLIIMVLIDAIVAITRYN